MSFERQNRHELNSSGAGGLNTVNEPVVIKIRLGEL